ncbi:MAG TPA: DUF5777 family beta-barrel protein [Chitinophagaceae bacterium]|nr:DUF5777 family beta-barrel protein [Chitinophagaceae bacterium]
MKKFCWLCCFLLPLQLLAQDSTINDLMKGMEGPATEAKVPVRIFNAQKTINCYTTEMVGRGKMEFNVSHNFGDIGGSNGGIKRFYGLDASTDIRIGFHIGLTNRLDLNLARIKGDELRLRLDTALGGRQSVELLPAKLFEIALKFLILRQLENDPSHPISMALFVNTVVSSEKASTATDTPRSFEDFSDRLSQVIELIIAKKIGKVSVQISPTLVHVNYVPSYDEPTTFALGAAVRIPFSRRFAFLVDYFHSFISDTKKENYLQPARRVKFYDPLGVGFEITTAGHIFTLKFTNTSSILENQFIPYNSNSWGKGQFRWAFNIGRTFSLWRPKAK